MLKRSLNLFAGAALALSAFAFVPPVADAASLKLCQPSRAGAALGPARWVAPTSGTSYGLNARGCAVIAATDLGDAVANGFIVEAPFGTVVKTGITTSAAGTNKVTIPAGAFIHSITVQETSGTSSPAGFLQVGTTNAGTDICCVSNNVSIPKTTVVTVSPGSIKQWSFSATAPTDVYLGHSGGVTNQGFDFTVVYGYF